MKKSLYSAPEPFTLSPLLAILPSCGEVASLKPLTTSFFARYEKVAALQKELAASNDTSAITRKALAEANMLKTTLDWLATQSSSQE